VQLVQILGGGVTCEARARQAAVIPAKAGIQSVGGAFPMACGVDSRFRGNDGRFVRDDIPNDTTPLDSRFRGNDRRFARDDIPNDTTTSPARAALKGGATTF
jgi:hypothetical protein